MAVDSGRAILEAAAMINSLSGTTITSPEPIGAADRL
jgi:hypothetical protein